jgi:hypothetical protein
MVIFFGLIFNLQLLVKEISMSMPRFFISFIFNYLACSWNLDNVSFTFHGLGSMCFLLFVEKTQPQPGEGKRRKLMNQKPILC